MKKTYVAYLLIISLLAVSLSNSSLSWFFIEAATSNITKTGSIDIELKYEPELLGNTGGFVLENTGTLAVFVRLGYTFQYLGDGGEPLMRDVSSLEFEHFDLLRNEAQQDYKFTLLSHESGGFSQNKIFLLPLSADNRYLLIKPGESMTADYELKGYSPNSGETLQVTWVAEALQASKSAVQDAVPYGWDPTMVP
ncbi:hypothetical protein U6B65_00910 [Oscillospiraceae bacterium MB08-C2-2]|nr:hypothetical protein U6B65_00910 [Oscillospiraceae bacterium MB08-C2-2]